MNGVPAGSRLFGHSGIRMTLRRLIHLCGRDVRAEAERAGDAMARLMAGTGGARCPRAFPVAVTGFSPRFRVGSALRSRRASPSLVSDGSGHTLCPGSRQFRDKGRLPRFATPASLPETSSRAVPRRCGCASRRLLPHQNSRPGLAKVWRRWSTCRPRPTDATGFAVKCCKNFHQMAMRLACYPESAQLPRRMQWRS